MSTFKLTLKHHFTPADKARSDYAYVPFALPDPATRLHIRYRFSAEMSSDEVSGGNVVDIGLFDPRGREFPGGAGFRGWSGSARREFFVALTDATPGYTPGPLPAGEYQVILGLYRVWEKGVDVEIQVTAKTGDWGLGTGDWGQASGEPQAQPSSVVSRQSSSFWLRGDLQSHTVHSDATGTLEQLIAKARSLDLDFLAVTDHNTVSHHPFLPAFAGDDLLLIRGQEVTTYYGHMNVWHTSRWCDFRSRTDADIAAIIELAHGEGALCSINHPKQGGPAWEYTTDLPVDSMEVWQGPWPHRNTESLALWDRLLAQGRRLPAVGGSDYHCPSGEDTNLLRLGQPTTWVKVHERSVEAVLAAIAAGRATISATPDGPRIELSATVNGNTVGMGDMVEEWDDGMMRMRVEVLGGRGKTLHLIADGDSRFQAQIEDDETVIEAEVSVHRYVRAELVGDMAHEALPSTAPADLDLRDWRWALSNPIYVCSSL
ncbi:MAG: CehA/McbA family metallohydrolase [Caldilineaceae bacterium]|nr:CehA/McbA family metallohydrolase [Caldilineaceae bacterium]